MRLPSAFPDRPVLTQASALDNTINNRQVFLRYAPEMQGYWNVNYGMRPTEFIASWIALHTIVKQIAPNTIMVWAPNTPQGCAACLVSPLSDR